MDRSDRKVKGMPLSKLQQTSVLQLKKTKMNSSRKHHKKKIPKSRQTLLKAGSASLDEYASYLADTRRI